MNAARPVLSRCGRLTVIGLCLLIMAPDRPSRAAAAEDPAQPTTTSLLDSDSQATPTKIQQTRHDLSLEGEPSCSYCHLAQEPPEPIKPQWDRRRGAATYPTYSEADLEHMTEWQPQGVSLVCLSCHDGTLGPDRVVDSATGALGWNPIRAVIGTLFASDHPISVAYARVRPGGFNVVHRGRVRSLPLYGDGQDRLECASCHNAHFEAFGVFLRAAAGQGTLCRTCHIK